MLTSAVSRSEVSRGLPGVGDHATMVVAGANMPVLGALGDADSVGEGTWMHWWMHPQLIPPHRPTGTGSHTQKRIRWLGSIFSIQPMIRHEARRPGRYLLSRRPGGGEKDEDEETCILCKCDFIRGKRRLGIHLVPLIILFF